MAKKQSGPVSITLPHDWTPLPHQQPVFEARDRGVSRFYLLWHRRGGKDATLNNLLAREMFRRPGLYYYMAPSQTHARKIIWNNVDDQGRKPLDQAIPHALRSRTNDQEMLIETIPFGPNGEKSILQVVGSDNYNSIVGTNPVGIVFSEWALAEKPEARSYLELIVVRNKGWMAFNTTPRGMNHAYKMWNMVDDDPDWFTSRLSIDDTGLMTREEVDKLIATDPDMTPQRADQEFYVKFNASSDAPVFQPDDIKQGIERELPAVNTAPLIMGVDVALGGGDATCIRFRRGDDARSIKPIRLFISDSNALESEIIRIASHHKPDCINVDASGLGMPIAQHLRHRGLRVNPIPFNSSAENRQAYANKRAEMYGRTSTWLRDGGCIDDGSKLIEEMSVVEREINANGQMKVKPKDKLKKDIGRSPDDMDALVLTFAINVPHRDIRIQQHYGGGDGLMCNM